MKIKTNSEKSTETINHSIITENKNLSKTTKLGYLINLQN